MTTLHKPKICILGANGFIGSHLVKRLLSDGYELTALDVEDFRLLPVLNDKNLKFVKRDFRAFDSSLKRLLRSSEIIVPLVAVATPKSYVTDPIGVFELDFEANLPIVRFCVERDLRLIFPSTSEVYGLSDSEVFEESNTSFSYGPIRNERWIYASCKQLLDRIIYAYGSREGLRYTIFRPFNWLGPGLDSISNEEGTSRLVTQLISDIAFKRKITLVDGGQQRRCFTDITDGIDALVKIIERPEISTGKIYNLGNPTNEYSVSDFARLLLDCLRSQPVRFNLDDVLIETTSGTDFYGKGYQDVSRRVPSILAAKEDLDWAPKVSLRDSLVNILSGIKLSNYG